MGILSVGSMCWVHALGGTGSSLVFSDLLSTSRVRGYDSDIVPSCREYVFVLNRIVTGLF